MALSRLFSNDLRRSLFDDPIFNLRTRSGLPSLFDDFFSLRPPRWASPLAMVPPVDIRETDKAFEIDAEVPGLKKDDVAIEFVDDNTLVLKGRYSKSSRSSSEQTQSQDVNQNEGNAEVVQSEGAGAKEPVQWSTERLEGSFQRVFTFPGKVDTSAVQAQLKDGLLKVVVPKPEHKVNPITIQDG